MCRQPDIRTEIPEHTGRSSRHGFSVPERNTALSRVLKVPDRHLQTPQELHPPLADIGQIEPCAAMTGTSFQHGKHDARNTIQCAEVNTAHLAPAESSEHYFRRRHPGFQARHHIESIQRRAGILSIMQINAVQREVSGSGIQWSSIERLDRHASISCRDEECRLAFPCCCISNR